MISELVFAALGYALRHVLASVIIALIVLAVCRIKAVTAEAKAAFVLAALLLSVAAPLPPFGQHVGPGIAVVDLESVKASRAAPPSVDPALVQRNPVLPADIGLSPPLATLLVSLWFAGMACLLGRRVRANRSLRRIVAESRRAPQLESRYRNLLPAGVEIHLAACFGPAVVGVTRPKILIPEALAASLPEHALRAVILHEATHVRRHDPLAHALQKIAGTVCWWNPAIHWMSKELDMSREVACDVRASRSCESPADYAEALLTAIEQLGPSRASVATGLGVGSSGRLLEKRINGVIEQRRSGPTARLAVIGAVLFVAAASVVACAVSPRVQPLLPAERSDADLIPQVPVAPQPVADPVSSTPPQDIAVVAKPAVRLSAREEYERIAAKVSSEYNAARKAANREYNAAMTAGESTHQRQLTGAKQARLAEDDEIHRLAVRGADEEYRAAVRGAREQLNAALSGAREAYAAALNGTHEQYIAAVEAEKNEVLSRS